MASPEPGTWNLEPVTSPRRIFEDDEEDEDEENDCVAWGYLRKGLVLRSSATVVGSPWPG